MQPVAMPLIMRMCGYVTGVATVRVLPYRATTSAAGVLKFQTVPFSRSTPLQKPTLQEQR